MAGKYQKIENMPVYSGIYTTQKNIQYLKESKEVYERYKKVIFLPAFPAASAMYNEVSIRAPWEMDVEYAGQKSIQKDIEKLENQKNIYYILDKNESVNSESGFYKSSITQHIKKNKRKVDSTALFDIYSNR